MWDEASLIWVHDVQVLVLKEALSVGNVVVQMRDASIKFAASLLYRFTHLRGDDGREFILALCKDARQSGHLLETFMEKLLLVIVVVTEALVWRLDVFLNSLVADCLVSLQQLVVLRVHWTVNDAHLVADMSLEFLKFNYHYFKSLTKIFLF